ncbi:hypothetical protein [Pseudomonas sp. UBA4194]|uniref:hypothetical protein n=1 Tax=Pseudomonas sp. UBA4194 TaxID=1947317 RepID=UPI0025CC6C74|nr:hypothetical protein [Pseudomonas sp. UBA4194]
MHDCPHHCGGFAISIDLDPIPHISSQPDEDEPFTGGDASPLNDADEAEVLPDDPDVAGDDGSNEPS